MDNHQRELMAMATETICELNTLTDAQAQELQRAREEIEQLKASLYDAENALARCGGWGDHYWGERNQARRWARAWKRAAKKYRALYKYYASLYMAECERRDALEDLLEAK